MLEEYPELLTPYDISEIFQLKAKDDNRRLVLNKALNLIKSLGIGIKVGKRVYVKKETLIKWLDEQESNSNIDLDG
jgi:hypothetical protein